MATAQNVELYRGVLVVILVKKEGQDDDFAYFDATDKSLSVDAVEKAPCGHSCS
jgi:hypothetical protein